VCMQINLRKVGNKGADKIAITSYFTFATGGRSDHIYKKFLRVAFFSFSKMSSDRFAERNLICTSLRRNKKETCM